MPSVAFNDLAFSVACMEIEGGRSHAFYYVGDVNPVRGVSARRGMHRHPHYELVFIRDGEFIQHLENGTFRYQKGDACLLNRNISHREGFESDCRLFYLNFRQDFFERLFAANEIRPHCMQYTDGPIRSFVLENRTQNLTDPEYIDFAGTLETRQALPEPLSSQLLDRILDELRTTRTGFAFRIQALLLELFAELENPEHYHASRIRVGSGPEEFIYSRLVRYLQERHGRATRRELEGILHYNGDYLGRIVKRQSGMTLSSLGQKICLEEAERLLRDTDMSISDIIHQLGYVNRSHFYRMFEEVYELPPLLYREKIRGNGH